MERDEDSEVLRLAVLLIRLSRGLTQKELATAAGMAPSSISGYENGRTKVRRKTADRIAVAAGLDLQVLESLLPGLRPLCRIRRRRPSITMHPLDAAIEEVTRKVEIAMREVVELAMVEEERNFPPRVSPRTTGTSFEEPRPEEPPAGRLNRGG
jgi:transcriptional regulator with XRE-family HTH domain